MRSLMNKLHNLFNSLRAPKRDEMPPVGEYVNSTKLDEVIDDQIAIVVSSSDYAEVHPDKGATPMPSTEANLAMWSQLIGRTTSDTARQHLTEAADASHELCQMRDLVDATFGETSVVFDHPNSH
jgi:hypothetical protein